MKWNVAFVVFVLFLNVAAILTFYLVKGQVTAWTVTSALVLGAMIAVIKFFRIK